jgi:hypothetical protein
MDIDGIAKFLTKISNFSINKDNIHKTTGKPKSENG